MAKDKKKDKGDRRKGKKEEVKMHRKHNEYNVAKGTKEKMKTHNDRTTTIKLI